jgi:hypothetical protein
MKFTVIRESLDEMNKWEINNPNAPRELSRMTYWEGELNYISLTNFQGIGENLEKVLKNSMGIYAKLYKAVVIMAVKFHLP